MIKIVLFVSNNLDERDFKTQAIFKRDSYYSVGSKIVPETYEGKKRLKESLVFIVEQLEVINNDFYVYAKDINLVDTSFFKKRIFDDSSSKLTEVINTIRSKLLSMYHNINESQKGISKVETSFSNISNNSVNNNSQPVSCSKHAKIEYSDESTDNNGVENISGDKRYKKSKNSKKSSGHHLHSDSRLSKSDAYIIN
ncbi:465_t:CDS:2, partial [Scutellospora calospora]